MPLKVKVETTEHLRCNLAHQRWACPFHAARELYGLRQQLLGKHWCC